MAKKDKPKPEVQKRPDITPPEGMRVVWCDWPDNRMAYMLIPKIWTVEHVEAYFLAKDALRVSTRAGDEKLTTFMLSLTGALGLVELGHIQIHNVEGLDADPMKWDLKKIPATILGWINQSISSPIEATQRSPLPLYAALLRGGEM